MLYLKLTPVMIKMLARLIILSLYFLGCSPEKIEPILPPPPPLSDECELISFSLKSLLNESISYDYNVELENDTILFSFPHFTDLSAITASFEISKGATLIIDSLIQKSDTTANSFYNTLNYTVVAENDSNKYDFLVKSEYPLIMSTIGHSGETDRVGGGDFLKEQLYTVSNIINGKWTYSVEALGFNFTSSVEVSNHIFTIPNFISEKQWLEVNGGQDLKFPFQLKLSCDSLHIKDSTFVFEIHREQFTVRSWQDLQYVSKDLNGHYEMKKDVVFPLPGTNGFSENGFMPIGDSIVRPFKGSFNGNNHIIKDFFIRRDSDTTRYVGLFGFVERKMDIVPIIKNLGVEISDRQERGGVSGGWFTGGLIGWNEGKVINCYVKGSVESKSPLGEPGACGGLIGINRGGEIISSSAFNGTVTGAMHVGGLVGENSAKGVISKSYASQQVYLSGLGAYDDEHDISGGGFVGRNTLASQIINCYTTGNVEGALGIGGFAGRHSSGSTIRCCYSTAQVTELNADASKSVGGFIGHLFGDPDRRSVTDSYWNIASNAGLDGVGDGPITGIDGRSILDFKSSVMFIGWDFPNTWNINSEINNGMAYLVDVRYP